MNTRRVLATLVPVLLCTLFAAGCIEREPMATFKKVINAEMQLAEELKTVRDADSAKNSASGLQVRFQELHEVMTKLIELIPKHRNTKAPKATIEKLAADRVEALEKLVKEMGRLAETQGLPIEFWRVAKVGFAQAMYDEFRANEMIAPHTVPQGLARNLSNVLDLLKTHGHDRVVTIHFDGLMMGSKDSAVAKVKAIVPNATFIQLDENLGEGLVVGPVEDFKAFVRALDFGQITCEDEAQRRIEMNVDSFKLRGGSVGTNRGGNMQMHGWPGQQQEETGPSPFELERQKREKERQAREAEQRRQRELEKQLARQRELQGPDRTDPRYFEKMAERMISGDKEIRDNTLGALLKVDPSEVGSSETSKRIARQYKALLSEGDRKLQANGIHGVALWGGSYSVPMLLELLGSNDCDRSNRRVILEKLAEFQDPRAVQPVVALLQDPASRHEAYECLEKLGPLAEDVLIQTAPSSDPMVCQAAVELLGKVGTSKSLPILRQAASKGSSVVREKAKMSIRQIMYRKKTASGNTANTF